MNGHSPNLWTSWEGECGLEKLSDSTKRIEFKYNSTMVMCFHIEFTLSGFHALHLTNIFRRKFDYVCDKLLLAIYDY